MRPVTLTLRGIRSYRDTTTLEFGDLSLFALIGDTGAGKSSLIEALCLALYSSTTWNAKNVGELIADSANQMSVQLIFDAAGERWTVTRSHKRTGAPIHKLEAANGTKVDGAVAVNKKIQELLGLTRDQFLRAVVMPQGQFEKLLRATPTERTEILKGVFRLQSLSAVRDEVGTLLARWNGPVERFRGERQALGANPAEALGRLTGQQSDAERRVEELNGLLIAATGASKNATELASRAQSMSVSAGSLVDAVATLGAEDVAAIATAAKALASSTAEATKMKNDAEEAAQTSAERAAETLDGFETRDSAIAGQGLLNNAADQLRRLETERVAASTQLADLDQAPPPDDINPDVLATVERTKLDEQAARDHQRRVADDLAGAKQIYAVWAASKDKYGTQAGVGEALQAQIATSAPQVEQAKQLLETAQSDLDGAELRYLAGARHNAAAIAAEGCQPGDACPVCNRKLASTFTPPTSPDLDALNTGRRAAAAARDTASRHLAEVEGNLKDLNRQHAERAVALQAAHGELQARGDDLGQVLGATPADNLTEREALADLVVAAELAEAATKAAVEAARQAGLAEATARADLKAERSRWEADQRRLAGEYDGAVQAIADLRGRLASLPSSWHPAADATDTDLVALGARLEAAVGAHAGHVADVDTHRGAARAADQALTRLREDHRTQVSDPLNEVLTLAGNAARLLETLSGQLEHEVKLPASPSKTTELTAVQAFLAELTGHAMTVGAVAATTIEEVQQDAGRHQGIVAEVLVTAGVADVDELRELAATERANLSHLKSAVVEAQTRADRASIIDDALNVAEPFIACLDALHKLLRDSRFVSHLVREHERALLAEASRVLKRLSSNRFGFADSFRVVDMYSTRERDPETLSGGERFQASLALALALVEIATRGGGQLEAVFVDEGFGSLDAASLDQALSTLGSVASGGKLVTLVSHLRQVAEHVDQVLLVERTDEAGSTIRRLDPTEKDQLLADDARSRMTG